MTARHLHAAPRPRARLTFGMPDGPTADALRAAIEPHDGRCPTCAAPLRVTPPPTVLVGCEHAAAMTKDAAEAVQRSDDLTVALALMDHGLGVTQAVRAVLTGRATLATHTETIELAAGRALDTEAATHEAIAADLRHASRRIRGVR